MFVRSVKEEHIPDIQRLFEDVFDETLSRDLWLWKYSNGRGCSAGVWRDGQLVGHYGGMKREVLFYGEVKLALQIGDVMVSKTGREGLSRKGAFSLAASFLYEGFVGTGKPFFQAFGFPNDRAMRIAAKLGFYQEVDRINELLLPAKSYIHKNKIKSTVYDTAPRAQDQKSINKLWRLMCRDLNSSIVGVRDWTYLNHRYFQRPGIQYQCHLVRTGLLGSGLGCLFMRPENGTLLILDIVAPLANIPTLIQYAQTYALKNGLHSVKIWLTKSHLGKIKINNEAVVANEIVVPAQVWSEGISTGDLNGRWWLTAGDSDFL